MKQIQWFPGHMSKARREVEERLPIVDMVFELIDARLPLSSRNPMIDKILLRRNKPRLIVLTKKDLADPEITKQWLAYFKAQGHSAIAIDSKNSRNLNHIAEAAKVVMKDKFAKEASRGMKPRAVRVMIVGIPNVGKSTLINKLVHKKVAKIGDRPGVTKTQQWIRIHKDLELLDTPGILWPKFEDYRIGLRLATTGAIKDDILPRDEIVMWALRYFLAHYPGRVEERYGVETIERENLEDVLQTIAKRRGALLAQGEYDYEKVYHLVLDDIRSNRLGTYSLETPADYSLDADKETVLNDALADETISEDAKEAVSHLESVTAEVNHD